MFDFHAKFSHGLKYHDFLNEHASEAHRQRWEALRQRVQLTDGQREILGGFVREMKVLCLAGAWCGDCVNQCPIFERFAETTPKIDIRYFRPRRARGSANGFRNMRRKSRAGSRVSK